jgi:hypothetical protein
MRVEPDSRPLYSITQARNASANIAACSAWVLANHAGSLGSGDETFSSGATLALPSFRDSFLLRDGGHSKRKVELISSCQKLKRRNAAEVTEQAALCRPGR